MAVERPLFLAAVVFKPFSVSLGDNDSGCGGRSDGGSRVALTMLLPFSKRRKDLAAAGTKISISSVSQSRSLFARLLSNGLPDAF